MNFSIKMSQRAGIFIITALMLATAAVFSTSFILAKQANAVSGVVDTDAPTAPGAPTTATPTRNSTMQWNWTAATDLPADPSVASGIKGYQYRFSGPNGIIIDWTDTTDTTLTTAAQFDGFYQLEVRAVDNAGNVGPTSIGSAEFDQTPPTVVITSPTNGTTVDATKKITFTGSTGDATSYTISIGKTGQTPVGFASGTSFSSYVWDTTNVPNDSYIATLTGTDQVGNMSTAEVLVIVNNPTTTPPTGPSVTVNAAKYTSNCIVVTGTAGAGTTKVTIIILDSKNKVVETGTATYNATKKTWSYTVRANLANATYTVQAHAVTATGASADAKANIVVSVQCGLLALIEAILNFLGF